MPRYDAADSAAAAMMLSDDTQRAQITRMIIERR